MGPMKSITHFYNVSSVVYGNNNSSSHLQVFLILWKMSQHLQYSLASSNTNDHHNLVHNTFYVIVFLILCPHAMPSCAS
jgi:hypothetical protein